MQQNQQQLKKENWLLQFGEKMHSRPSKKQQRTNKQNSIIKNLCMCVCAERTWNVPGIVSSRHVVCFWSMPLKHRFLLEPALVTTHRWLLFSVCESVCCVQTFCFSDCSLPWRMLEIERERDRQAYRLPTTHRAILPHEALLVRAKMFISFRTYRQLSSCKYVIALECEIRGQRTEIIHHPLCSITKAKTFATPANKLYVDNNFLFGYCSEERGNKLFCLHYIFLFCRCCIQRVTMGQ